VSILGRAIAACLVVWPIRIDAQDAVTVDLIDFARRGALLADTRDVTELIDGGYRGVRLGAARSLDVAWIDGVMFSTGTIELDVRGKDAQSRSFIGLAIGGVDDSTYESVFLRPFNFRATDPVRRMHAIQYESMPNHPWSRLRADSPEVYENPVDPPPDPDGWVRLRVVVEPSSLRVFVGEGADPDLIVDRIDERPAGRLGLWVGNFSDGDFANLRIDSTDTP
jgi:hypothetical protein